MKYNMNIIEKDLDNSLHVILVEKPEYVKSLFMLAIPAGGFDIDQKVDGQIKTHPSGVAHFLEHQMFRLNGKDVTDDFARMQAQTNAFTSYTETAYYFQTTAEVEKPLSLLLDFVENLDITEASVNKEKGIILSEYNMYDQSPEQRLMTSTWKSLYHKHPFKTDILGTKEDIENMSVEQLENFYRLNYDPSRLTLVGVTGKDINEIMDFIEKHQKNVEAKISFKVAHHFENEPVEVVTEECLEYMDISTPYVCVAYKLKPCGSVEESLRQDIAMQIRLDSLFSPLNPNYQKWIDERIVSSVAFAECDFNVDHGYVLFATQTEKVDEFIKLINILESEIKKPIDEEILHAIQVRMIAQNIRSLDNFDALAIDLMRAHFEKYDYFKSLDIVKELDQKLILELCSKLDLNHKSVIKIFPKSFKTSNLNKND